MRCEQLLVNMVPLSVRTSIFCRLVLCRAPTCDLRFQAVAGGYRTCSCIVRVRQSYSCILCTHVTKPLSYTLPDRSRPSQRRSSAAIRLQQAHNTMDACTPPAHSERLARDRAGAGRPPHMRRRTLRALRPRPRHLQPARRPLRADSHYCSYATPHRVRHRRSLLERRHSRCCRRTARHCCCHTRCRGKDTCESRTGALYSRPSRGSVTADAPGQPKVR